MTEAAEDIDDAEIEAATRLEEEVASSREASRAVAVIPKQRIVATSDVAIWDTAALDHMGRVGAIMAESKLASPTIYDGVDAKGVVARMVMIANLARECGANPLMFLQGCSIISNKLHLEGKIVAAVITARTGVKLRYRFGVWVGEGDEGHITFPDDPQDGDFFLHAGDRLAVRAFDPDDPERFVDGYVGAWKTTRSGSPWSKPSDWRRQLRYRGAPEWARAYEPGAILGFYSDADDDIDYRAPRSAPVADERLTGAPEGFKAPRSRRKPEAEAAPNEPGEPEEASHARQEPDGDGKEGRDEVHDAEFEDSGVPEKIATLADETEERPTTPAADTATDAAQPAGGEPDTSASAAPASEDSPAPKDNSPAPASEATSGGSIAPRGEIYTLAGDVAEEDGRIPTYKDGVAFSRVKPEAKARPPAYDRHPPAEDEAPAAGDEPAEFAEVGEEEAADVIMQAVRAIREAPSLLGAKQTMKSLAATDAYGLATLDQKAGVRLAIWTRYTELFAEKAETIQPYEDFSLMRMFLEFGAKSEADIDAVWMKFWRHAAYKDAGENDKRAMNDLMVRRKAELKEPA